MSDSFGRAVVASGALLAAIACRPAAPPTPLTAPRLWNGLVPGKAEAVGFERIQVGDTRVDLWYPARRGGRRLRLADYLVGTWEAFAAPFIAGGVPAPRMNELGEEPAYAWRGAPVPSAPFPLVLVAHGNGQDAFDQSVMAEYLASHGYLVASVPSPMVARPMTSISELAPFAEAQADALARADSIVRIRRTVRGATAIVAHSFGARSALLYAMRGHPVRAIVSLDGGIGTLSGIDEFRRAPSFDARHRPEALLHMYERLDAFMRPDFTLLRELGIPKLVLQERALHHVHFTTLGFLAGADTAMARLTRATPATRDISIENAIAVRSFLDELSR